MMVGILDLRKTYKPVGPDYASLRSFVSQLVGEPFLFARFSYGDELTLHFGTPREPRSPRLKTRARGSYILGVRGSAWHLKSGLTSMMVDAGLMDPLLHAGAYRPISPTAIEQGEFIQQGARVLAVEPHVSHPTGGYALLLSFADGSSLIVRPTPHEVVPDDEPDAPEVFPVVADWELMTPHNHYLWVGPGLRWGYEESVKVQVESPANLPPVVEGRPVESPAPGEPIKRPRTRKPPRKT